MSGPSHWHGEAKDAGHDEMVLNLLRTVNARGPFKVSPGFFRDDTITEVQLDYTEAEYPVYQRDFKGVSRLVAFVDLLAVYGVTWPEGCGNPGLYPMLRIAYEAKPVIHSVGALIRQCKAIGAYLSGSGDPVLVRAAAYRDDPKVDQLIEMMGENMVHLCDRP